MTHYFLITSPGDDYELCDAVMRTQENGLGSTMFIRGARLDPEEVQEPVVVELDYPEDVMPEMFDIPLLMREDLLADVLAFGVDNIDSYECHLVHEESGTSYNDYRLCNIIGLIDVFDMAASELHEDSPPDAAYLFDNIVIDENKAEEHHIFRPYGRISQILVSEELKEHLEATGKYKHLEFVHPDDFA